MEEPDMVITDDLESARRAVDAGAWTAGRERLARISHDTDLTTPDLFRWATAARLLGRDEESLGALQRALAVAETDRDEETATRLAAWLAFTCLTTGRPAVAGGWLGRAEAHAAGLGPDSPAVGLLRLPAGMTHLFGGRLPEAGAAFEDALRIGVEHGDADLIGYAHHALGRTALFAGRVPEGLRLLDEAMAVVLTGRMHPVMAGVVFCSVVQGCQQVEDLDRARQWTAALSDWCDQQPDLVAFTGQCSVHRAQILMLDGAFPAALEELARARDRYELLAEPVAPGETWYEQGEVHRLLGDTDEADQCYRAAAERGRDPQPGRARLCLDRGDAAGARVALERALTETDGLARAKLLPVLVEAALTGGAGELARGAAGEMSDLAERSGVPALLARAAGARGQVALSAGEAGTALRDFRTAERTWRAMPAPYELAVARMWVGQACRALGDVDTAVEEIEAARAACEALGVRPAQARCRALLGPAAGRADGLSGREVEVLRLVAAGHTNPEIAQALHLSEKTVARHLSNIFTKLDVHTRTAAAGYAFAHHLA